MDLAGTAVSFFREGGIFMYIILAVGVGALFIFIDRAWALFRASINGNHFMARIQSFLITNNIDDAIKYCNSASRAPLARVIKAGLSRAAKSEKEILSALEVAALDAIPKVQKRTAYLSMFANISTLLGLLGTIVGLIVAFKGMVNIDPAVRQTRLAEGISQAMNTTAFGLMVAIPCLVLYSVLQNTTNKILDDIDRGSMKLMDLIKAREASADSDK